MTSIVLHLPDGKTALSLGRANAHIVAQDYYTAGGGAARSFGTSLLRGSEPIATGALSADVLGGTPQISGWGSATSRIVFNRAADRARGPGDEKEAVALPVYFQSDLFYLARWPGGFPLEYCWPTDAGSLRENTYPTGKTMLFLGKVST